MPKPPLEKRLAKFLYTYLSSNGYTNSFSHADFKEICVDGHYDLEDLAHHTIEFLDWEGKQ